MRGAIRRWTCGVSVISWQHQARLGLRTLGMDLAGLASLSAVSPVTGEAVQIDILVWSSVCMRFDPSAGLSFSSRAALSETGKLHSLGRLLQGIRVLAIISAHMELLENCVRWNAGH